MKLVPQKILVGFLNRNELSSYLALLPDAESKKKFWEDVAEAHRARVAQEIAPPASPILSDLPPESRAHLDAVTGCDAFQDSFGGLNCSFQSVQLDQLVPVQTFINLYRHTEPPVPDDLQGLLDYCLPPKVEVCSNVMLTDTGARFWSSRYGHGSQNVVKRIQGNRVVLVLEHPNVLQIRKVASRLLVFNGTIGPMSCFARATRLRLRSLSSIRTLPKFRGSRGRRFGTRSSCSAIGHRSFRTSIRRWRPSAERCSCRASWT